MPSASKGVVRMGQQVNAAQARMRGEFGAQCPFDQRFVGGRPQLASSNPASSASSGRALARGVGIVAITAGRV